MFAEAFSGSFRGLMLRIWRVWGDLYFRQRLGHSGRSDRMKESQLVISEVYTHSEGAVPGLSRATRVPHCILSLRRVSRWWTGCYFGLPRVGTPLLVSPAPIDGAAPPWSLGSTGLIGLQTPARLHDA